MGSPALRPWAGFLGLAGEDRLFRLVTLVVGGLLLTAAGLKLYGLNVTPVSRAGWFANPRVQSLAIEWELLLGLWLIVGWKREVAWLAALLTFLAFAGVSAYLGWQGVTSCGCFGTVKASPWSAFALDITITVLLLVAFRRVGVGFARDVVFLKKRLPTSALSILLVAACALLATAFGGRAVYGSLSTALARVAGEDVTVDQPFLDFGAATRGSTLEHQVTVYNWTDHPIRLVGGTSDCSMRVASELPLVVPPGSKVTVTVRIRVPRSGSGTFLRSGELWTDWEPSRVIKLDITGGVVDE